MLFQGLLLPYSVDNQVSLRTSSLLSRQRIGID